MVSSKSCGHLMILGWTVFTVAKVSVMTTEPKVVIGHGTGKLANQRVGEIRSIHSSLSL